jgi:Ca-activated chloride channel family protein
MGRHDTRDLSSGIETERSLEGLRVWRHAEPGCQCHVAECRTARGTGHPLKVDYRDLMIHQTEYLSSCAYGADAGLQPQHDSLW